MRRLGLVRCASPTGHDVAQHGAGMSGVLESGACWVACARMHTLPSLRSCSSAPLTPGRVARRSAAGFGDARVAAGWAATAGMARGCTGRRPVALVHGIVHAIGHGWGSPGAGGCLHARRSVFGAAVTASVDSVCVSDCVHDGVNGYAGSFFPPFYSAQNDLGVWRCAPVGRGSVSEQGHGQMTSG